MLLEMNDNIAASRRGSCDFILAAGSTSHLRLEPKPTEVQRRLQEAEGKPVRQDTNVLQHYRSHPQCLPCVTLSPLLTHMRSD